MTIKVPASAFANRKFPRKRPEMTKPAVHKKPRNRQENTVFLIVCRIRRSFPAAFASEIVGSNRTEIELVITDGNMMIAMDIPVRMP